MTTCYRRVLRTSVPGAALLRGEALPDVKRAVFAVYLTPAAAYARAPGLSMLTGRHLIVECSTTVDPDEGGRHTLRFVRLVGWWDEKGFAGEVTL